MRPHRPAAVAVLTGAVFVGSVLAGSVLAGCSGAVPDARPPAATATGTGTGPDTGTSTTPGTATGSGSSTTGSSTRGRGPVTPPERTGLGTRTATPRTVVVVLDPGHNGGNAAHPEVVNRLVPAGGLRKPCNTTGTATGSDYAEHAFTWDVARRTAQLLRRHGVTVVLTRSSDTGVGPCVNRRAELANRQRADLTVSIHADGASSGVRGFHVVRPGLAPDGGNRAILEPSARAARYLLEAFARTTGEPRATYAGGRVAPGLAERSDLAGLNLARVPAVFVECANMRNPADAANLRSPAWRQEAARGIARGVLAFVDGQR